MAIDQGRGHIGHHDTPERPPFVVAGGALDPHHRTLVELGDRRRAGVGARRAQSGHDLIDDVLDARTLRVEVHARCADALFEQFLSSPLEPVVAPGAILHRAVGGHPEALLVEPAVGIAQRVRGRFVRAGEPGPEHHVRCTAGEGERHVARETDPAVGPHVAAEPRRFVGALEHRRELRAADAGHHAGGAHRARARRRP